MSSSIQRRCRFQTLRHLAFLLIAGVAIGYAAEAGAIDRKPFSGGFVSDARPGYGAEKAGYGSERSGYGAERQYYGAENGRSKRRYDDARHYERNGSFIEFRDDAYEAIENGNVGGFGGERSGGGVFPGFGSSTSGSFIYFGDEDENDDGVAPATASRTRVIDVRSNGLDAQSTGSALTSVSYSGATKIIRIKSGNPGTSRPAARTASPALEPWSDAWQRYCKRAHSSFNPALGTFIDADGASRFCTGD